MNRFTQHTNSSITAPTFDKAESIEEKMRRVTSNKEPIDSTAPLIYTPEKDGVLAGYDIRTDRFEVALEAMDKVHASETARRDNAATQETKENNEPTFITE